MSKAWRGGSNREWRKIRAFVLWRDGYQCRAHADGFCEQARNPRPHTCTGKAHATGPHAGHAHHLNGKAHGDDPRFIVAACQPCNLHIGDPSKHADPTPNPRTRW